jgi:hypothetical protein
MHVAKIQRTPLRSGEGLGTQFRYSNFALPLLLVLGVLLRLAVFSGYVGIDDMTYISDAYRFAEGRFDVSSYFGTARVGMTGTLALFFWLFGPSLAAVVALPLTCSIANIVLTYFTGRVVYEDDRVALTGALFVMVYPLEVIYATQYFPDVMAATFTSVAFLCFYLAEKSGKGWLYFAAGAGTGTGYLFKETALLVLLPLTIYVIYRRHFRKGYVFVAAGIAAILLVEILLLGALFGDPLYRWNSLRPIALRDGGISGGPDYDVIRPGGIWLSPLVALLTNQEYGLFYFLIPVAIVSLIRHGDRRSYGIVLFFVAVGLYTLWGPTSLKAYRHLRPLERYTLPVTVAGMILLARWVCCYLRPKPRWAMVGCLVVSWLACLYLDNTWTYRSVGESLAVFRKEHPQKTLVLPARAYMALFVADGFRPPGNVAVLEPSGYAPRIDPNLPLIADGKTLRDCFLARFAGSRYYDADPIREDWQPVGQCMRRRREYVPLMHSVGGPIAKVADRLSPKEGYAIYYVSAPAAIHRPESTAQLVRRQRDE